MRTGICDAAMHPYGAVTSTRALAVAGGCSSLWLPDHLIQIFPDAVWTPEYTGAARIFPRAHSAAEPWTFLGYLARGNRFPRMTLGLGVTDASRRHPAVTAQAASTLQHLSRGRFILGVGVGERESNAPYGIEWSRPVGRLAEALATIRALWESDGTPISRDSEWFPLRDAVFDVPRFKGTRPPLWVAAHGPRMLKLAGRYGDGWYPCFPMGADDYGTRLQAVRDHADDAGRDPCGLVAAGCFVTVTGPSEDFVDELLDSVPVRLLALMLSGEQWARHGLIHPMGSDFVGMQDLMPQTLTKERALAIAGAVPRSLLRSYFVCGSVESCTAQLAEYAGRGLEHAVLIHGGGLGSLMQTARSTPAFVRLLRSLRRI